MRKLKNSNELYDLISQMKGGAKVSVGYVSTVSLPKTVENLSKPIQRKDGEVRTGWQELERNKGEFEPTTYQGIQGMKDMGRKGKYANIGINGIVKVSQFTTNWQTTKNYNKNRNNLERARESWLIDHGANQDDIDARRREATYDTINYGNNGINIEKNTKKTSVFLNPVTNTHASYSYYIIDAKGDTSRPISKVGVETLLTMNAKDPELIKVLDNVENAEEIKQEYREWCKAMKYKYRKYSLDNVLYIVGTVDGEKFFFFNDALTNQVDARDNNLLINPQAFLKIADEKAKKALAEIDKWTKDLEGLPESRKRKKIMKENRQIIRINESILHDIISKQIKQILNSY